MIFLWIMIGFVIGGVVALIGGWLYMLYVFSKDRP